MVVTFLNLFYIAIFLTCVCLPAHTTLELVACVMIAIRYTMDIAGVFAHYSDSGPGSMALCILFDGATLVTIGLHGGTASVVVLTLDRYWKIVHAVHHRKHHRRWMIKAGLLMPWFNGIVAHMLPAIGTTRIVNGKCIPIAFWPQPHMAKVCSHQYHLIILLSYSLYRYSIFLS